MCCLWCVLGKYLEWQKGKEALGSLAEERIEQPKAPAPPSVCKARAAKPFPGAQATNAASGFLLLDFLKTKLCQFLSSGSALSCQPAEGLGGACGGSHIGKNDENPVAGCAVGDQRSGQVRTGSPQPGATQQSLEPQAQTGCSQVESAKRSPAVLGLLHLANKDINNLSSHTIRMATIKTGKKQVLTRIWRNQNPSALLKCKIVQQLWKTVWQIFKKLNVKLPHHPTIAFQGSPVVRRGHRRPAREGGPGIFQGVRTCLLAGVCTKSRTRTNSLDLWMEQYILSRAPVLFFKRG